MNDTIYRQAAIAESLRFIVEYYGAAFDEEMQVKLKRMLESLPSAQPEPCDDPRADIYYLAEKIGIHRLYALVVELRGEPEPCEDTISRQQAITALRALSDDDGYINAPHEAVTDVVRGLPPVRAKQGQTVHLEQNKTDKLGVKAGETWLDVTCPNCGCEIHIESEIVRCKDCKYSDTFPSDSDADMPMKCLGIRYGGVYPYWYCEHAERRHDG